MSTDLTRIVTPAGMASELVTVRLIVGRVREELKAGRMTISRMVMVTDLDRVMRNLQDVIIALDLEGKP